ncbi:uncharacterized protein LOC129583215 [Paramacrobiotus metropolitanus]|uniref:uncharacterized protein LOC129583215 n=1 Tax=Paramacrobiotus metropolitanus TaxID=2943436 RepID=UPI0024457763|nr:uncharacterized protein LOC129583215 [Paramacrobiotus metropolitanus]
MDQLVVPQNALAFQPKLATATREKFVNGYFLNYLNGIVAQQDGGGIPHPLLGVVSQYHYGPSLETADFAIVFSPHGVHQQAEAIPVWIHESKAGRVKVKDLKENMLRCPSRRKVIGEQLKRWFCNESLRDQMEAYGWEQLWASSGTGERCAVWRWNFDNRKIYRVIAPRRRD